MDTKELRAQRAKHIKDARDLTKKAETEKRDLNAEDRKQIDTLLDTAADLKETIDREERLLEVEGDLERRTTDPLKPDPDGDDKDASRDDQDLDERERRFMARLDERFGARANLHPHEIHNLEQRYAVYDAALRTKRPIRDGTVPGSAYATPEYRSAFRGFCQIAEAMGEKESRALEATDQTLGGALVAPIDFQRDLVKFVDDMVYLRQWGQVRTVTGAKSLGFPSLDTDPADADWTTELAIGSEDSSMAFGARELTPNPLGKLIKVSQKLLRMDPGAEGLVRDRLGYKFGVTMEKAGLTGTGASQPLGVFTASSQGISTGRDVSTGNTTTSPTFDGLTEAKWTLKAAYWTRARWLFHRDGGKKVALLKDGDGQYLWRESTRVGEPDRLLGLPAFFSEFAPNTFTTGLYVGILGDFSNYWWADALGMTIQRLIEVYAATGQLGFIGRLESDGMPVLEEAFVRVKLA